MGIGTHMISAAFILLYYFKLTDSVTGVQYMMLNIKEKAVCYIYLKGEFTMYLK